MSKGVVLVTGAAGFIGSHVVRELLVSGRTVRATARKPGEADFLNKLPIGDGGALEIIRMELMDSKSVAAAVEGCMDIIHCAAALYVGAKDLQKDVVDPSIKGTDNLVAAINANGSIRRIIHTSSVAAIRRTNFTDGTTFSNGDWCDDAELETNAYGLAKAGAEKLIREWWGGLDKEIRPRLVTIHPSIVIGPIMAERHLKGSMAYVDHLLKRRPPFVLNSHINMVDVRDVATAHVRALDTGVNGERYIVHSGSLWHREMSAVLSRGIPKRKWPKRQLPKSLTYIVSLFHPLISWGWVKNNIGTTCYYNTKQTEEELGMKWIPLSDSIIDGAASVIDAGLR